MSAEAARQTALRLIERDEAIRTLGKAPPRLAAQRLLDFVSGNGLLQDPAVWRWLLTLARAADPWFSGRLLEAVGVLLEGGHPLDAHGLYRAVLGMDEAARWSWAAPMLLSDSPISDLAVRRTLGRPRLMTGEPATWGRTGCELLGRVVLEQQRQDWPSHVRFRAALARGEGHAAEAPPFEAQEDDYPSLWLFTPGRSPSPCVDIALAVASAAQEAAALDEPGVFLQLRGWLLAQRLAVGYGVLITSLLDGLSGAAPARPWHAGEAARLLSLDAVQRPRSLGDLRRLLRGALPAPGRADADAMADAIRRAEMPDRMRVRELAGIAAWGVLAPEEEAAVNRLSAAGELHPPADPRSRPDLDDGVAQVEYDWGDGAWPHPEDRWAVRRLSAAQQGGPRRPAGADAEQLPGLLTAIETLLGRADCDADRWFGEVLGWCRTCLSLLREDELARLGRDPNKSSLSGEEWATAMSSRTPWWRGRVQAALAALSWRPPDYHHGRDGTQAGGLGWGSSDHTFQTLAYLDEALAADGDGALEGPRRGLAEALDRAWPAWPPFTRATALCVLRPMYWRPPGRLRERLTAAAGADDALTLHYALSMLLTVGGPDLGAGVDLIISRGPEVEGVGKVLNDAARSLGACHIRAASGGPQRDEVIQLAALCRRVMVEPPGHEPTRAELITGALYGALGALRDDRRRTGAGAAAWSGLVAWACEAWPWPGDTGDDRRRFRLSAVTGVTSQGWPDHERPILNAAAQGAMLRVLRDGGVSDFCALHTEVRPSAGGQAGIPDQCLVELCKSSAARVAAWRRAGRTSEDPAWDWALRGHATAELIRGAIAVASDRSYVRRELPPVIDQLAVACGPAIATDLRVALRRL